MKICCKVLFNYNFIQFPVLGASLAFAALENRGKMCICLPFLKNPNCYMGKRKRLFNFLAFVSISKLIAFTNKSNFVRVIRFYSNG